MTASRGESVSSESESGRRGRGRSAPRSARRASAGGRGRAPGRCARARGGGRGADRRLWASSERATTSRPEVSRSRRWTMPRPLGLAAATSSPSASTSVPAARPAPGWTTRPAGLSMISRYSSWKTIGGGARGRRPRRPARRSPGNSTARRLRGGSSCGRARPSTSAPPATARAAAAREPRCRPGRGPASPPRPRRDVQHHSADLFQPAQSRDISAAEAR